MASSVMCGPWPWFDDGKKILSAKKKWNNLSKLIY